MAYINTKTIKGNKYLYAEHSFRLPDSTIKKISIRIHDPHELNSKKVTLNFRQKEIEISQKWAVATYSTDKIFTAKRLEEFEAIRVGFKEIKNKLTTAQFDDLLQRFTANFTYESNAIEGNSLTLKDVTLLLFEGVTPNNKQMREIYETKNTHEAHTMLFEGAVHVTLADILRVHRCIVKDMGIATGWKKIPNFLLMRNVATTDPKNVESEMKQLLEFYERVQDKWHPLKVAAHVHARFEKIHPFDDGNGRVGRVLLNAILLERGYPPLIIRKTMRRSYLSALEACDNNHYDHFERFLLEKFKDTYHKFFEVYLNYI